jgi:hypothetical protein
VIVAISVLLIGPKPLLLEASLAAVDAELASRAVSAQNPLAELASSVSDLTRH